MAKNATAQAPKKETSRTQGIPKDTLLAWYDDMLLVRRFEEKAAQLYGMGRIGGFCHLYNGQEAISTGANAAISPDDYIITAYRDHGLALSRGLDPKSCMAELLGKYTGTTKGKGGSMHYFSREKNFLGGHAIVGSHVPIGAGVGFGIKYKGERKACLVFMGDGATNIGSFFEGLGLAALWSLPVVFIIENNRYSMGTSVARSSAVEELYKKGLAFDMHWEVVDGMDVIEVYKKVKAAADLAKQEYRPTLLEIRTYRYRGHSMSDPIHGHYRTKEEVEEQKKLDPLSYFGSLLVQEGIATDTYFESAEKRIKKIVEASVEFAEQSPEPPLEELWKDVYLP